MACLSCLSTKLKVKQLRLKFCKLKKNLQGYSLYYFIGILMCLSVYLLNPVGVSQKLYG